jgi:hypothetical protein
MTEEFKAIFSNKESTLHKAWCNLQTHYPVSCFGYDENQLHTVFYTMQLKGLGHQMDWNFVDKSKLESLLVFLNFLWK